MHQPDTVNSAIAKREQIAKKNIALNLGLYVSVEADEAHYHAAAFGQRKTPARPERRRNRV